VIAQFYATLFVEEEPRRMHWMLEGTWYSVDYIVFMGYLGISEDEFQRDRIHTEQVLPPEKLGYMYPPKAGGSIGKVVGLYPTYKYLDKMFKKMIDCMGGDKGSIADYSRNCSIGWHQMQSHLAYLISSGVRFKVLVRGLLRVVALLLILCI
jgi:hypothetical protein